MQLTVLTIFFIFITSSQGGLIPRVVGGKDAPIGKYPFQIITKFLDRFLCGGTIINERYVLTAAHCVDGFEIAVYKVVTEINRQSDNGTAYQAEKFIIHENYNKSQHLHDIALIRVATNILYTKLAQPVSLPSKYFEYNEEATLIGFGKLGFIEPAARTLQELKLEIFPNSKCRSIIPYVRKTHICTLTEEGEGACNGDSGGALISDGKQIGIVSFGVPCAQGAPDVYTRVQSYLTWIKNNTKIIY
ncbi:chymotrypsin-1-like [Leptopilina heterotoma]|uniref:chymotrypsin-1-like n=1 Tax=Leptopilina heterotoma TaxID=63436 RepID=UPI001CA84B19|nr:chymotrypsin-1-like [Leptopilina heterotoma]